MPISTFDIQTRVASLGFLPGTSTDPRRLFDGVMGPATLAAVNAAKAARGLSAFSKPEALFHASGLCRIILHWTAGAYGDISLERERYHSLIAHDGQQVPGKFRPEANSNTADGAYAAHTLGMNQNSIGLALDAMGDAVERPFDCGMYPITDTQLAAFVEEAADFCVAYDIPVSRYSVLTHAEVQSTLGRRQKNKWDVCWLPGMDGPGDPHEVGDRLRTLIQAAI